MRTRIQWEWERLDNSASRVKVIGGWIVKQRMFIEGKRGVVMSETMVFVPDTEHRWAIAPPVVQEKAKQQSIAKDFMPLNVK